MLTLMAVLAGCGGSGSGSAGSGSTVVSDEAAPLSFFEGPTACADLATSLRDWRYRPAPDVVVNTSPPTTDRPVAMTPARTPIPEVRPKAVIDPEDGGPGDATLVDGDRLWISRQDLSSGPIRVRGIAVGADGSQATVAETTWPVTGAGTELRPDLVRAGPGLLATLSGVTYDSGALPAASVAPKMPGLPPIVEPSCAEAGDQYGARGCDRGTRIRLLDTSKPTLDPIWQIDLPGRPIGRYRDGDRLQVITAIEFRTPTHVDGPSLGDWLAPLYRGVEPTRADCETFARPDRPGRLGYTRLTTIDVPTRTVSSTTLLTPIEGHQFNEASLLLAVNDAVYNDPAPSTSTLYRFTFDAARHPVYSGGLRIGGTTLALDESPAGIVRQLGSSATAQNQGAVSTFDAGTTPSAWQRVGRLDLDPLGASWNSLTATLDGDRGYLQTAEGDVVLQVLDLANPAAPALLGQIGSQASPVPGYTTIGFRPLGADRVLIIRRTAAPEAISTVIFGPAPATATTTAATTGTPAAPKATPRLAYTQFARLDLTDGWASDFLYRAPIQGAASPPPAASGWLAIQFRTEPAFHYHFIRVDPTGSAPTLTSTGRFDNASGPIGAAMPTIEAPRLRFVADEAVVIGPTATWAIAPPSPSSPLSTLAWP